MILGGYGSFGKRIASQLASKGHDLLIVGRNENKARDLVDSLNMTFNHSLSKALCFDINQGLDQAIEQTHPVVVIHTCGPFQGQDFKVLAACLKYKVDYIDLSDGREFIQGIRHYDQDAKDAGVTAITGASTVPALSSAVLAQFQEDGITTFDDVRYGISPGQKTDRGLATAQAVLSYIGRPIICDATKRHGWQDTYLQKYPEISSRLMGNCEVPDLDLLPEFFPISKLHFSAGMESKLLHMGIWVCSWLVRLGLPLKLSEHAKFWMKMSRLFDRFGSDDGGMHVVVKGRNKEGVLIKRRWFLVAKGGDGPFIPTVPAVILADKLAKKNTFTKGVLPCVGLISLQEYLNELSHLQVTTH
nr:saccharopine dehydrogenase NADP-binding domain-containing protein [Marinicella rhabdoformis]